jgi:lysyl-tRNA synthetase class 2
VPSPGLELHLDAFAVQVSARETRYLITSPEYQLKRLLAGGLEKIYSLGKVFRRGEQGPHHNPEFTMLEWYRAHAGWEAVLADTEALIEKAARAITGSTILRGGLDVQAPWPRLSVREACLQYARVAIDGDESVDALRAKLTTAGHRVPDTNAWDDLFFSMWLDHVEPHFGKTRPTVVYDWPLPLCALARQKPSDPRMVERFEVYAGGIELCNAFGELIDPVEQRRRLQHDLAERAARGLPAYPIDEAFLGALGDMPEAAGNALGIDRVAMLLLGTNDIADVLPFTFSEL